MCIIVLNLKPLSEVLPGLLFIQIQIQAVFNHWGHAKGVLLKTFFLNSTETFIVHCQLDRALQLCLHHNIDLSHRHLAVVIAMVFWSFRFRSKQCATTEVTLKEFSSRLFFWIPQRLSLCIVNLIELCNYACTIT